jgi:hypothetical protein
MKKILKTMASVLLIVAFAATAVSCSKDDDNGNNQWSGGNVYVTGYGATDKAIQAALVCKNGHVESLTNNGYAVAYSVFASDSNVYVVGNHDKTAVLWKNGVAQPLTDGTKITYAKSVFVSGNDVYVAGYQRPYSTSDGYGHVVKMWKNGVVQDLTSEKYYIYSAGANSVFVSGDDVYVAGWEDNTSQTSVAKLWKNGVAQSLTDGTFNAEALSVFVSGSNVYVAGYERNANGKRVAKLWINEVAQSLTDGTYDAQAKSVYVSGNDVYVAGGAQIDDGLPHAKVWKNGIEQNIDDRNHSKWSVAYSVFVSENDVYVAGEANEIFTLWKNGKIINMDYSFSGSTAYSVFVQKN